MNTSNGPVVVDPTPNQHVNTSRVVEEDLAYTDEDPEIIFVLPAAGWAAVVGDEVVDLVAFVALDSGRMYGVVVGEDGRIDLTEEAEKHPAWSGYVQTNNEPKENQ
jgi:hypothetical protein